MFFDYRSDIGGDLSKCPDALLRFQIHHRAQVNLASSNMPIVNALSVVLAKQ